MMPEPKILTIKRLVIGLGSLTLVSTAVTVALWLLDYKIIAAALISATVALWILLMVIVTVMVTAWWTRETMHQGAELALRAQDINDRWDASKMKSLADLIREGARIGRVVATPAQGSDGPLPPLLLPGQENNWLPALADFDAAAVEVEQPDEH